VVLVRLILAKEDAASDLRQHDEADEVVFQSRGLVIHGDRLVVDLVDEWQGINLAVGSLIDPFLEKNRILLRFSYGIGGNGQ
jgi:hypothetical protein